MEARELSKEELVSELRLRVAEIESLKTRPQHAQDDVWASEERQRTLLENPIVSVGLSDGNQVLYANRLLLELFGYSDLDEFLSIPLIDHVAPSSRAAVLDRLEKSGNGVPSDSNFVYDIRRKDGSLRTIEINVVPYRWKGKSCRFALFRDITERKRAEEAFRESEAKYRALVETTGTGYVILDLEGRVLDANPEYVRLTGHGALLEIVGRKVIEWTAQHDIARNAEEIGKCLEQGSVRNLELDYVNTEGKFTPIEINATTLQTAGEKRILTLCRDITERRRVEEALRESEARLNHAQMIADVGSWEWNIRTGALLWSEQTCRQMGEQPDRFTPSRDAFSQRVHPEDRAAFGAAMEQALAGISPFDMEFRIIRPNGEIRILYSRGEIVRGPDHRPQRMVGVCLDITERKRAEKEKAKLQAQILQAQKIASVGRLAGGVAHDFNNMLGVIIGHSELALSQLNPNQPLYEDLTEIRNAAERSTSLTRQLLAYARKQTAAPSILDLNQTVTSMLNMLQRLIGENINLNWNPAEILWPVKIDPSQLDQILANLIVNARDAITGVGKITIETKNCTLDEDYCASHIGSVPGEYVTLTVSDDGCGIDKETLAQIFEPFFTTKDIGKGTGLGLATVYGIVKQNNGFINACSEPGHGTTFNIYLPRQEGKAGQAAERVGSAESLMRGQETVLLVEDNPSLLKLTARMIEKQGYTVLVATTPGEAHRLAAEYGDQIHILMTDVVMPEMNGQDLAKELMSLYPNLKLLFMSGYTADVIAHNGVLDEGVHFIQKPFSAQSLTTKLREVLDCV